MESAMDHAKTLYTDGLTVLRQVVPAQVLARAKQYARQVIDGERGDILTLVRNEQGERRRWYRTHDILPSFEVPELLWLDAVVEILNTIFIPAGYCGNSLGSQHGIRFKLGFAGMHFLAPGCEKQPLHRDFEHLFRGAHAPLPPVAIALHIPVVPFRHENGATRIIPGTHHRLDAPPALAEEPPEYEEHTVLADEGDVFLRDFRVWHAAGQNRSGEIRCMFSIGYLVEWFGPSLPVVNRSVFDALPGAAQRMVQPRDG